LKKLVTIISYGDLTKAAMNSVERANTELLMRVTSTAKSLTPVDSGILRNSIMWKTDKHTGGHEEGDRVKHEPKKGDGVVGSATEYAAYQEFGTRRMKAQPYLRPAVTLEILGPNGQNTMKKESIDAFAAELTKGRKTKVHEF